jgi:hypothetical protein
VPRGRPKGSKNKTKVETPVVKQEIQLIEKKVKRGRKSKIKIADVQVFETTENDNYSPSEQFNPFETTQDICECSFQPVYEWNNIIEPAKDATTKLGFYSSTRFPIKTNKVVYPVMAYITADVQKYRSAGMSDKQIYSGCINYLTKTQSKNKLKRLGDLYPLSYTIKENRITATFFTTERKSKMFWGEGG